MRVVATLRSDYLAAALLNEEFIKVKGVTGQLDLLAPKPAALRSLIVEPARQAGLHFDRSQHGNTLADTLLNDASGIQDALPLLEYVLRELYEHRTGSTLTFHAYVEIGGLHGAIGLLAEKLIDSLPVEIQAAVGSVFWQLVSLNGDGAPIRRRATYAGKSDDTAPARLLRSLVEARFATAHQDEQRQPSVILAHDYLFAAWPRLREWVQNNHRLVGFLRRIEASAKVWDEEGRKKDYLLNPGEQVSQAESLLEMLPVIVTPVLRAFVEESNRQAIISERSGAILKDDLFSCFNLARDAAQYVEERLTTEPAELDEKTQAQILERLLDVQIAMRMAHESVYRSVFVGTSQRASATKRVALVDVVKSERRFWNRFAKVQADTNIRIDFESILHIPPLYLNEQEFRSALYQVLMNAIKATDSARPTVGDKPNRTSVEIRGRQTNKTYLLEVVDFGIGFPANEVSSVFRNGFRGELAQRRWSGEGTGLWMARSIMESLGGALAISSLRHPTVLSFIFPRALSSRPDKDST